jgi:anti-anti-sigma factor
MTVTSFAPLRLSVANTGKGTFVVSATGECDLSRAPRLEKTLRELGTWGSEVALDMSGVTFIDSGTLNVLSRSKRTLERAGSKLVLVSPSRCVTRLLAVTGLEYHFGPAAPVTAGQG